MTTFNRNDEMPAICHKCGKFMEKKISPSGSQTQWTCVNKNCITNKQPTRLSV